MSISWRRRGATLLLLTALAVAGACSDASPRADGGGPGPQASPVEGTEAADRSAAGSPQSPSSRPSALLPAHFPAPGAELLEPAPGLDLVEIFHRVARGIRYEPYRGVLRGAAGTALSGAGNDVDQALLLAELLQRAGYRTRFVRGDLDAGNRLVLLRGRADASIPELTLPADYRPWHAADDPELLALAGDHVWVEVFQGPEWLPLDPSFPRSVPGEAYAVAGSRFDDVPDSLHHRVRISYHAETREDGERELGVLEGTTGELGLRPLSLLIHAVAQSPAGPVTLGGSPGGIAGGIAGALSGGRPEEDEPTVSVEDVVGISYRRVLRDPSGESVLSSTFVLEEERGRALLREWLEIETRGPGVEPVRSRRILFDAGARRDGRTEPRALRRHVVTVVPGPVPLRWLREERARWRERLDLGRWRRELEPAAGLEPGADAAGTAGRLASLEAAAGLAAGHLLNLTYAAESDSLTRRVARAGLVVPVWSRPRILISSFETDEVAADATETLVSLDLRIDDVDAHPLPGAPWRAPQLFRMARGLQGSMLEGVVVARATGTTVPVTTAALMQRVDEEMEDGFVVVSPAGSDRALREVEGLPRGCRPLIREALDRGREVILPRRAVRLAGRERWGWWELDPEDGTLVGVMEGGQHQGMTEYKLSLERVGLNDRMGWGIGAIVGATGTLFSISALLLEYGEATDEMVEELKVWVKGILCHTCASKAEAKVGSEVSVSVGGDCFKQAIRKDEVGAAVQISFCDQYEKGFKCTSGLLLAGLTGQDPYSGPAGELSGSLKLGCADTKVGGKVDDGGVEVQVGDRKMRTAPGG